MDDISWIVLILDSFDCNVYNITRTKNAMTAGWPFTIEAYKKIASAIKIHQQRCARSHSRIFSDAVLIPFINAEITINIWHRCLLI